MGQPAKMKYSLVLLVIDMIFFKWHTKQDGDKSDYGCDDVIKQFLIVSAPWNNAIFNNNFFIYLY